MTQQIKSSRSDSLISYSESWGQFAAGYKGKSFLKDVTRYLAEYTGVCYVLVGYPANAEMTQISAAVLYAKGNFIEDYSYPLSGTPCENVVGRSCCYYPSNIQKMFPNDEELKHLGIESYIGLPIPGPDGKPLGLVALMDSKLIQNPSQIEEGLKILKDKIAKELRRKLRRSQSDIMAG